MRWQWRFRFLATHWGNVRSHATHRPRTETSDTLPSMAGGDALRHAAKSGNVGLAAKRDRIGPLHLETRTWPNSSTLGADRAARMWGAAPGALLAACARHPGGVNHAALNPEVTHLVTTSADKFVRVSRRFSSSTGFAAFIEPLVARVACHQLREATRERRYFQIEPSASTMTRAAAMKISRPICQPCSVVSAMLPFCSASTLRSASGPRK